MKGRFEMYKALYRKWRPLSFDDVISQPHITTTLKNQIINQKTAHAYLFTGSRGTGKTTCARILAKAVNCRNPQNGAPCLQCDICKAADSGMLPDIVEIDAASNTGVDDMRELRDSTVYTPELCRYKVYIIDEVHMLSTSAFNALLKIMEEPPAHVKFILATTEVHKVPATIISRCQRFDFRRIRSEDIVERLKFISREEKIELSDDAAWLIARIADGGMRDALSLLDQCIAYSDNVTLDTVSSAAGIAGRDYLFDILEAVSSGRTADAINILNTLYGMSKDMQRLCDELLAQFRNLMLIKTVSDTSELIACLPSEMERLKSIAAKLSLDDILQKMSVLQDCNERLSRAVSKRAEIEMCFIRLCSVSGLPQQSAARDFAVSDSVISELKNRIEYLENALKNGAAVSETGKKSAPAEPLVPQNQHFENEPKVDTSKVTDDMLSPVPCWTEMLERLSEINPGCAAALKDSQCFVYENLLYLLVKNEFFLKLFKENGNAASLGKVAKEFLGKTFAIRAKCVKNSSAQYDSAVFRLIEKAKNSDIEVEIKK